MRKALIVGIDDYPKRPLVGCVKDAQRITEALSQHDDETPNFECKVLTGLPEPVTRAALALNLKTLFSVPADIALFYFSGHGAADKETRYLVTHDYARNDEGLPMERVLTLAQHAPIREVVILLDCCYAGGMGGVPAIASDLAVLREGLTVVTASRSDQFASETTAGGVFTSLVYEALRGGAADILGHVTMGSVYSYADQVLGAWDQRPLFKSHISTLTPLRKCAPRVDLKILRLLPEYFSAPDAELPLDPSYEPTELPSHEEHERIFSHLQKLRSADLVHPVGEEHLYYAAKNSKACRLTPLGKFYWHLAARKRL
ncbi:MAG TPA: caspase family protein [Thermoanaerobaculia bacterium]|nr:caspase family protein [Thermoanaerobaculia bacterium]